MLENLIIQAINNKKILEFIYDGHNRIVEPHVLGIKDGKNQFLSYQIRGTSKSGGIPDWRRFELNQCYNLRILDEFLGQRPGLSNKTSHWDRQIAIVG